MLLTAKENLICHQVNCMGKFGKGIALQIRRKYPVVHRKYLKACTALTPDELLGKVQVCRIGNGQSIVNVFSQYSYGYGKQYTNYEAMREAISKLPVVPQILLNDAVTIPKVTIPQVPIIKGDAKSVSIAGASIIAKVTRDRLMMEYDKVLPEYGFAANKGYGAANHIEALKKYGPSPIHRATFIGNFVEE